MSSRQTISVRCVLFDLDGTLLDTAPDMGAALNMLLAEHDRAPLRPEQIRPQVSNGSVALVRLGFPGVDGAPFERLRLRFLDLYAQRLHHQTRPFDGAHELLEQLETIGVPWGIVTNKPGWLTEPLLEHLALRERAALAAGMRATFARYGYYESLPDDHWGAEAGFDSLEEFARWLAAGAARPGPVAATLSGCASGASP